LEKLLNEGSSKEDLDWLVCQLGMIDNQLKNGKASFPNIPLGDHVWARTGFSFSSGEVTVQIEDLKSFNNYVHFSEKDWYDFIKVEALILPILRIAESRSVFTLEQYLQLHPTVFKRDSFTPSRLFMLVNDKIHVAIQLPQKDIKHAFVEIRYYNPPGEEEILLGLPCKLSPNKVVFPSGLYDFFSRFVMFKLTQSCQCWKLMHTHFSRIMKDLTSQPPHHSPLFARNPFDF
jgi:hypothetical protein